MIDLLSLVLDAETARDSLANHKAVAAIKVINRVSVQYVKG
ncbi:hypothetical protein ymoll0001_8540 [Yersinia mollaretii ATCC 43969]|uniref:Uncharacterized protein n=1 Tax=Yersinia mollaretii (strain ATCC 43969 / DSM 18520 / CIP 103324 / CNY 7263 / WAIP 204) TaxID=349967 RepID=A0ABP2EHL8_YERMW|nr:hypothetical protein ymoll0001_8540 [Yersinia mollaretii ATCC 43969]